jgi:hypothetical protein
LGKTQPVTLSIRPKIMLLPDWLYGYVVQQSTIYLMKFLNLP